MGQKHLYPPAIKAAEARKYKDRIVYSFPDPHEMMVQVTCPQDRKGPPDVRQELPGGVLGCVYVPAATPITIPSSDVLPPSLTLLLHTQPIMPALAPQSDK